MVRTLSRAVLASMRAERSRHPAKIFTTKRQTRISKTDPKPTYNRLPIFIAECLHTLWLSCCNRYKPASCPHKIVCCSLVAAVEFELDDLSAFFRRGEKAPLFGGVLAG